MHQLVSDLYECLERRVCEECRDDIDDVSHSLVRDVPQEVVALQRRLQLPRERRLPQLQR